MGKVKLVCHDLVSKRARLMIVRDTLRLIRGKKPLQSRSDEIGDGEPTGEHNDAKIGAQSAFTNAKQGRAPREHRKSPPSSVRGEQSAECEQRDGGGTRKTDRQNTNARSVPQDTHRKPLPSTMNNHQTSQTLPIQGRRLSNEVSLSNGQISAEGYLLSSLRTQTTDVSGGHKTLRGEETPGPELQGTEIRGSTRDGGEYGEVMGRISNEILKIQKDFPSIRFEREITRHCSLPDVEMALVSVVQAYGDSMRSVHTFEQKIEKMDQRYQNVQSKSHDDLSRKSKEYNDKILQLNSDNDKERAHFEGKISVYEKQQKQDNDRMREIQKEHDDRMRELQREHEEAVYTKNLQIQQLASDLTSSSEGYVGEINLLKEQQRKELMGVKSDARAEIAKTKSRLEDELRLEKKAHTATKEHYEMQAKKMTKKHEDEKRQVEFHFVEQKSQMENELSEQNRKMAEEFQSENQALKEDLRLAKADFESQFRQTKRQLDQEREGNAKDIERIRNAHGAEKRKMRDDFEVEKIGLVRGLKETVESLKGALVERDHFKAMSDPELAHRFEDISVEVDEFARVQWDIGRESLWPFPGQSFRKSENQRRTKQYIIQNTLWVVLYESIFCTPFRILGNQGKSLEATWIEKFGQGKPTRNCSFSVAKMHKIPNLQERRLFFHRRLKNRRNGGTRP
jgi:hypothetical protein